MSSMSLEVICCVTDPDIDTEATAPVIVGVADGIIVEGDNEGVLEGTKVGAGVINTSQNTSKFEKDSQFENFVSWKKVHFLRDFQILEIHQPSKFTFDIFLCFFES